MSCTNHPDVSAPLLRCAGCVRQFCRNCVERDEQFHYCPACHRKRKPEAAPRFMAAPPREAPAPDREDAPAPPRAAARDVSPPTAGLAPRACAFLVDAALVGFVLFLLLSRLRGSSALVALVVVPIAYEALFVQHRGQTIGKSLMGIQVASADGDPVSDSQAWGRAVVKVAQLGCCGLPLLSAAFTSQRQGLHDYAAGTRVVEPVESRPPLPT